MFILKIRLIGPGYRIERVRRLESHETMSEPHTDPGVQKARELRAFLFLTMVLVPVLSVAIVGGYGFLIWMYQLFAGPPSG